MAKRRGKWVLYSEEDRLQQAVCEYMDLRWKKVPYHSIPNGVNKSVFDQWRFKVTGLKAGVPDLLIPVRKIIFKNEGLVPISRANFHENITVYGGLYLELKPVGDRSKVYKINGELRKSKHVEKQNEWHKILRRNGYRASFLFGFDECKAAIDSYLKI